MKIDIDGVPIRVPERYPLYSDEQKAALTKMVHSLRKHYGTHLLSVFVTRAVPRPKSDGTRAWRFDGGYATGTKSKTT